MKMKLGNTDINKIYLGNADASKYYLGDIEGGFGSVGLEIKYNVVNGTEYRVPLTIFDKIGGLS
jgi:hypothetical protein